MESKYVLHILDLVFNFQTGAVLQMPVPSSYNDIYTDTKLRDFVGWAWYDRQFYVSQFLKPVNHSRLVFRVDSAHYEAKVVSHLVK